MNRIAHFSRIGLFASLGLAVGCSPGSVSTGGGPGPGGGGGGADASVTPSNGRAVAGLQVLYTFQEGSGTIVGDSSGTGSPTNLTIGDLPSVSWIPGGGLSINSPTVLLSEAPPSQLMSACMTSGAITLEVWAKTADVGQNGRVINLSNGNGRNFELSQATQGAELGGLSAYVHTTDEENTDIEVLTPPAFDGSINHIVYTRNGLDDAASVFLNGQRQVDNLVAGGMGNWGLENYQLSLANDVDEDDEWRGELYLAAVYCRDLSAAEIQRNYNAGY